MFKSNYNNEPTLTLGEELKKKVLKKQQEEPAPSVQELDAELQGNKPAVTKKLADKSLEFQDQGYKFSAGLEGNYISKDKPSTDSADSDDGASSGTGAKVGSAAIGALGMVSSVMSQKKIMTKKENNANIMNLTAQGAQAGMAFGPWGALIGAGVGAAAGGIMSIGDKEKLENQAKIERVNYISSATDAREKAQRLDDGKKAVQKNKDVLQAQMGILGSKYSTSKNS